MKASNSVFWVVLLSACSISMHAIAQERRQIAPGFPSKPIRVMTTVAAGGGLDIITRGVSAKVGENLAFPVVVDNVSGANGVIAVNTAINAPPDGHTILSGGGSMPINTVFRKFEADIRTALAPVAQMSSQPYMVFIPASSPINSFKELIANARANPGKLTYGSSGVGSVIHMGMELIEYNAQVDMVHVPYKGNGQANIDLAAGRLNILMGSISGLQLVRAGKAKMLAVTTPQRMPEYPDMPTIAESGLPGYELSNTYTLYAPGRTPAVILNALNREVSQALNDPDLRKKMLADASTPAPPRLPAELRKILNSEIERWEAVVKKANIKLEE
jgi:tripartite-type tricarboxylate transporter receptor subunit TctC